MILDYIYLPKLIGYAKKESRLIRIVFNKQSNSYLTPIYKHRIEGDFFNKNEREFVNKFSVRACLRKEFNESCPICEYIDELKANNVPLDKYKSITLRLRYFALVLTEDNNKVQYYDLLPQEYEKIISSINENNINKGFAEVKLDYVLNEKTFRPIIEGATLLNYVDEYDNGFFPSKADRYYNSFWMVDSVVAYDYIKGLKDFYRQHPYFESRDFIKR